MHKLLKEVVLLCTLAMLFGMSLVSLEHLKNVVLLTSACAEVYSPVLGLTYRVMVLWDFTMVLLLFTYVFSLLVAMKVATAFKEKKEND